MPLKNQSHNPKLNFFTRMISEKSVWLTHLCGVRLTEHLLLQAAGAMSK